MDTLRWFTVILVAAKLLACSGSDTGNASSGAGDGGSVDAGGGTAGSGIVPGGSSGKDDNDAGPEAGGDSGDPLGGDSGAAGEQDPATVQVNCSEYRQAYPAGPYGAGVGQVLENVSGLADGNGTNHRLDEVYADTSKVAMVIVHAVAGVAQCSEEADKLESIQSSTPGLQIVTLVGANFVPGSASDAASWQAAHQLDQVIVWADTTDYFFWNFAPAGVSMYPSTMVINLDTMEMTYFGLDTIDSASSAIQEIMNADHPCATM